MDDNVKNPLGDQVKKMNIALYYVGNDMVKAKQMLSSSYKDLLAIKGKFSSSSLYGVFIIFFNKAYSKLVDSKFIISPDYSLSGINTSQDWKTFEKDLVEQGAKLESSRAGNDLKDKIDKSFNSAVCVELSRQIERNDPTQAQHIIQKILQETSTFKRVDLKVEFQELSSLDMELDSLITRKLDSKSVQPQKAEAAPKPDETASEDVEPAEGKNGIKLIVRGTLNLSPIKGKHISQIVPGDRVMVTMIDTTNQTVQIASAFKAYDEEKKRIMPVPARVVSIKFFEGVGYKLYMLIAKGVLAQVIEEETNIKVALDPVFAKAMAVDAPDEAKAGLSVPAIIGLAAVIIVLLMIVVFIVF